MKRTLLAAVAIAIALVAVNAQAREASSVQAHETSLPKYSAPTWRYQWFEGRWWYWMPEKKWVYWSGSRWAPFEGASQAMTRTSYYGNFESQSEPAVAAPVTTSSGYCPPSYSAPYSAEWNGSGYGGYGWSWGPGTAFRNSPGGRF